MTITRICTNVSAWLILYLDVSSFAFNGPSKLRRGERAKKYVLAFGDDDVSIVARAYRQK